MNWMIDPKSLERMSEQVAEWEQKEVAAFLRKQAERREQFFTIGDIPVKRVYTAADVADIPLEDIGLPGRYPFTRGPYPTMYRSRHWTMRQIAGFGTGEDTNKRFKYLITQGQTGLSTDFDMPTLMGYDSDDPMSEGEVGREGVAVDTLADMEALYRRHRSREDLGFDDDQSVGVDPARDVRRAGEEARLRSEQALRHDPGRHPQGVHGAEGVLLSDRALGAHRARLHHLLRREHAALQPDQHLRLSHLAKRAPRRCRRWPSRWRTASSMSRRCCKTGMDVDEFAPRLAFYFVCQGDFFEEIAKFRAARRVWAKIMKKRFGAKKPGIDAAALPLPDRRARP